ncbi:hypothetical protein AYO20_06662 [Fonsecaea nubica]|uniref:non-specific serine/threonine protein kinase n=1 Tax=Fonsecaea nubica TaxID=856822 RepID=A0A178CXM5_9EURO|nr:hypothetical protein AYO20_06662 [Fonsecaea nubica]OAL34014.1 hypothetical protein AYO20_06662 [Fonsecaea nubica]
MSPGDKKTKSLEDKAPEPLSSPHSLGVVEEDSCLSQTSSSASPPSSKSTRTLHSQQSRPRQSPFFAGSRRDYGSGGYPYRPARLCDSTPSPRDKRFPETFKSAVTASSDVSSLSSPLVNGTKDSSSPFSPSSFSSHSSPTSLNEKDGNLSLSRAPRRVLRPDNWWQKHSKQSPSDSESARPSLLSVKSPLSLGEDLTGPPTLPRKSPLRPAGLPLPAPTSQTPARKSESESHEDRALWEELSPPPLCVRKTRLPVTPSQPEAEDRQPKTLDSAGCQEVLESPAPEHTPLTREFVLRRLLSEESFKEATRARPGVREEEELDAEVIAHRKKTLEILESSPEVYESNTPLKRTKTFKQRRRAGATFTMDSLHPDSASGMTAHRREAVRLAQEQQRAVVEKCKRSKQAEPDYAFDELIGKGSFGRVYKGRQLSTSKVVAIKVLDIDEADFHAFGDHKDEQIRDFNREIRILRQAQESGAENLNQMIEALPVHSQLWLVCEYCPGGSVKTLMRATNDRLSEKYIVIVARELAKALKGLHQAGIMHRDVKAANVLIHQEGRLELCDFGVATILDTQTDKRKTFIGTLHWMPPELWTENPEYSDEVDVWEYGCTIYECAMGRPPNSDLRERQQLKMRMRRLKQAISLPENENFSDGLRSLVSYALTPDANTRPSMEDVLQHDFLKDTEETHPTSMLTELVQTYYAWLFSGGQRISLFMPGGAAAASAQGPDADLESDDEWNFSMTQDFEKRVSAILEIPDFSEFSPSDSMTGEETPKGLNRPGSLSPPQEMTAAQKANFEARVKRGADLSNLFDQDKPAYEYKTKTDFIPIPEQRRISDLPFRAMAEDRPSSIASNVIDLGDFDEADYAVAAAPRTDDKIQTAYAAPPLKEETIRLADASTLREKRANSKGPRDPNNQSLTARRASSAEGVAPSSTSAHDFATSQEEWTIKNRTKAPELQEPAEITSSRPGHATMDWSFANAMSEAAMTIPQINVAPEPEPTNGHDIPGPQEEEIETEADPGDKTKRHKTMDWSFSSAMAEAKVTEDYEEEESLGSSPPTTALTYQKPHPGSRPTPTRPAPLARQMTMPVTIGDFAQAEEQEIPRPSTALSEAYSDVSASSTDVDPFGLERDNDEDDRDHPGPATMDEDVNMGGFYSGRGRTMLAGYSSGATTPLTASGPRPAPYALGRPARIGEDGFPGPSHSHPAAYNMHRVSNSSVTSNATAIPAGGAQGPLVAFVPPASPPSTAAMSANASNDEVEAELMRLLEGMQGTLNAAREVVGGLERRRAWGEEEEWVSEEE